MAEQERRAQIEQAAEATAGMLMNFRHTTGRHAEPEFVRQQAAQVLHMMGIDAALLDDVVREVEHQQDISLDGFFIVPAEPDEADAPGLWQPPSTSPLLQRYLRLLEQEGWPGDARTRLKRVTQKILGRCGNPATHSQWSRRGMVVGDVQSGKTTSYVSLICAAIDAGYRNIVVLGGRTNDLRHQTQERVDLGVTGIESSGLGVARTRIGVGLLGQIPGLTILSLTSQDHVSGSRSRRNGGDFDSRRANHNNIAGSAVRVAVIKKHATMIGNVAEWLKSNGELASEPLLLIDDEADDASIDTNDPDETPTAINGAIRELLKKAGRHSYVAYTATPYANVMIDPEAHGQTYGDDLFPRDFIALLTPPPVYFGARRFLKEYGTHPRTVEVTDTEGWIHRGNVVGDLPASLRRAVREFVLVSAVRRVRRARLGLERQHETMLIHASVRTGAHGRIHTQVEREVERLQAGWDFPVAEPGLVPAVEAEFLEVWDGLKGRQDPGLAVTWEELRPHVSDVFAQVNTETINGVTKAGLDYRRARKGPLTVIAIGGAKLSRGLTLEGLTTSYHLRASLQHDTLMQMCRWFGYRAGYEDLCRLHAQPDLLRAFADIMESDEELRAELEDMSDIGASPLEFGIRIRTSPGMTITARNKLRHALTVRDALAGKTLEVTRTTLADARYNDALLQDLVRQLGMPRSGTDNVWDDVPWETLQGPLKAFHEMPSEVNGLRGKVFRALSYIGEAQAASPPRLQRWTVVLAGREKGTREPYGGVDVVRVRRGRRSDDDDVLNFGAISDPADEQLARGASAGTSRKAVKKTRPRDEGLLIIYPIVTDDDAGFQTSGVAISFPDDTEMRRHNYVLNPVAQAQELAR